MLRRRSVVVGADRGEVGVLVGGGHLGVAVVVLVAVLAPLAIVRGRDELSQLNTVLQIVFLNGIGPAGDLDDRAVVEVLAEQRRVDGGRHEDDADVGVGVHHVPDDHHDEVGVDVALVDLVDDDVRDATEAALEFAEENTDRAEHDGAIGSREHGFEPDTVPDRQAKLKIIILKSLSSFTSFFALHLHIARWPRDRPRRRRRFFEVECK